MFADVQYGVATDVFKKLSVNTLRAMFSWLLSTWVADSLLALFGWGGRFPAFRRSVRTAPRKQNPMSSLDRHRVVEELKRTADRSERSAELDQSPTALFNDLADHQIAAGRLLESALREGMCWQEKADKILEILDQGTPRLKFSLDKLWAPHSRLFRWMASKEAVPQCPVFGDQDFGKIDTRSIEDASDEARYSNSRGR